MVNAERRVLCCGTFDYLHPGHLSFLKQAAALGDDLHVVIARDENVLRIKGVAPDHAETKRQEMVAEVCLGKVATNKETSLVGPGLLVLMVNGLVKIIFL